MSVTPGAGQVIVLNGGSSAGSSSIARELQEILPGTWLTVGVDTFIEALPGAGGSPRADITSLPDGTVRTGETFRSHEQGWYRGLVAMAQHGVPGMARRQALTVHEGVRYDVEVDTTQLSSAQCAAIIARSLA